MMTKTPKSILLLCYIAAFPLGLVDAQERYEGTGNCSTPCAQREEFCGNTNTCFPYSCNNWYLFGPPEYTGHDGGSSILILLELQDELFIPDLNFTPSDQPAPLECQADSNDMQSTGIIYGCSGWSCEGNGCKGYYATLDYGRTGVDQEFTRRCEATNGQNRYVCYDLVGVTNLQSFRSAVENFRSAVENFDLSCPLDEITNSTDPYFIYQVTLGSPRVTVLAGQSSMKFNSSLAGIAMHSYVEEAVGSSDNGSSGNQLVGMLGLWTITTTTIIGVFFLECFV